VSHVLGPVFPLALQFVVEEEARDGGSRGEVVEGRGREVGVGVEGEGVWV